MNFTVWYWTLNIHSTVRKPRINQSRLCWFIFMASACTRLWISFIFINANMRDEAHSRLTLQWNEAAVANEWSIDRSGVFKETVYSSWMRDIGGTDVLLRANTEPLSVSASHHKRLIIRPSSSSSSSSSSSITIASGQIRDGGGDPKLLSERSPGQEGGRKKESSSFTHWSRGFSSWAFHCCQRDGHGAAPRFVSDSHTRTDGRIRPRPRKNTLSARRRNSSRAPSP